MIAYKYLILSLIITLSGCASDTARTFTPFTVEIKDTVSYNNDLKQCQGYAGEYLNGRSGLNASQMASAGATAGFNDLGYSALSPTAPVLGALGGLSGEAVSELGLNSEEAKRIITYCLQDKGFRSGAYRVYDPHL